MNFLIPALVCVLSCVIAYFLCGIPSAYLVGRALGGIDVRTVGSGNIGATNITRAAGPKAGLLTLACDVLKAVISVGIGYLLIRFAGGFDSFEVLAPGGMYDWMMALVYGFCVIGHVFSPYMHFKGGKGIAVGLGGALMLSPLAGVSLFIPFLLLAVTTRYVSLGSICAAASLPFWFWLYTRPSVAFLVIVGIIALFVVWAHRSNIKKLASGNERKFSFKERVSSCDSTHDA